MEQSQKWCAWLKLKAYFQVAEGIKPQLTSDALFTLENELRGDKGKEQVMATSRLPIRDRDSGAHNMLQQRNVRSILTKMGGAMIFLWGLV